MDIGRHFILQPPLLPELHLHYLTINGIQPIINENPSPLLLNKYLYSKSKHMNLNNIEINKKMEYNFPVLLSAELKVII